MEKTKTESSKFVKQLRKWSRILHRDIGFLFVGASLIYGLSGIMLNHLKDWNPSYTVENKEFTTDIIFSQENINEKILELIKELKISDKYKSHYYPTTEVLRVYLTNSSILEYNTITKKGRVDILKRRIIFYHTNYLHYNPNKWWTVFSDFFAGALILFAITSLFMIPGKKGAWGRGGIYIAVGIIIPILILIILK